MPAHFGWPASGEETEGQPAAGARLADRRRALDLAAIESSLRSVQRDFARINRLLDIPRDELDDQVIANLMAGYAYVDALVCDGVDLFAVGQSHHFLELNARVLCGTDARDRARQREHLKATEARFYEQDGGGIGQIMGWYALHRTESAWNRAAGAYVRILSEPQLFIEGNHRTGALIMSCVLARDGKPPFVLTVDNAKAYFDPSTLITKTRKSTFALLFRVPKLKRQFAQFLEAQANERHLCCGRDAARRR